MKKTTILTVAFVGLAHLLTAGSADARGPRASLASATACALDLGGGTALLVVTTTLTNKSSGGAIAEVRGGKIKATYKPVGVPGNVNIEFDSDAIGDLVTLPTDVDPELTISTEFDICDVFREARQLNGRASVDYGLSGGDGKTRTVSNRCTDDPDTELADEGPIKVADFFDLIEAACAP